MTSAAVPGINWLFSFPKSGRLRAPGYALALLLEYAVIYSRKGAKAAKEKHDAVLCK
jgi:hypothetical protein